MKCRCIVVALLAHAASTNAVDITSIYVSYSGTDSVGGRFALVVRERVAASPLATLVAKCDDADVCLALVSADGDSSHPGQITAVGWTTSWMKCAYRITRKPDGKFGPASDVKCFEALDTSGVRVIGAQRVDESAEALVATILDR